MGYMNDYLGFKWTAMVLIRFRKKVTMSYKIIKLPEVMVRTGLSRSSLYNFISKGLFPKQCLIGVKSVGWLASEVDDWIAQRANLRGGK